MPARSALADGAIGHAPAGRRARRVGAEGSRAHGALQVVAQVGVLGTHPLDGVPNTSRDGLTGPLRRIPECPGPASLPHGGR